MQSMKIVKMDKSMLTSRKHRTKIGGEPGIKSNKAKMSAYLKSHNIHFKDDMEEDGIPRITMVFQNCMMCPGKIAEGCIFYFDDFIEVRVYYSKLGAEICRNSNNMPDMYRLVNFLNARLWPRVMDGMEEELYSSQYLFYPRFYVMEDGRGDIAATMLIPYTYFEMDELETEDFITVVLPDLMNSLSPPIFLLLMGKITADEAITIIKSDILGESRS